MCVCVCFYCFINKFYNLSHRQDQNTVCGAWPCISSQGLEQRDARRELGRSGQSVGRFLVSSPNSGCQNSRGHDLSPFLGHFMFYIKFCTVSWNWFFWDGAADHCLTTPCIWTVLCTVSVYVSEISDAHRWFVYCYSVDSVSAPSVFISDFLFEFYKLMGALGNILGTPSFSTMDSSLDTDTLLLQRHSLSFNGWWVNIKKWVGKSFSLYWSLEMAAL